MAGLGRLTYRQRMFVEAYLGSAAGNATEAARIAGYQWPDKTGPKLTGKSRIRTAIVARLDEAALSTSEILARLSEQATGSIEDFVKLDKRKRVSLDIDRAQKLGKLGLVRKIKRGKYGLEIELYDAQAALVHLSKYRRLFDDSANRGQVGNTNADAIRDFLDGGKAGTSGPAGPDG